MCGVDNAISKGKREEQNIAMWHIMAGDATPQNVAFKEARGGNTLQVSCFERVGGGDTMLDKIDERGDKGVLLLQGEKIGVVKVNGRNVKFVDNIAAEEVSGHFIPFFVANHEVVLAHKLLQAVISFGVNSRKFFKGFMVSVKCEFAAPKVNIEMIYTPAAGRQFGQKGCIIFLVLAKGAGSISNDVEFPVLVSLTEDSAEAALTFVTTSGSVNNESVGAVLTGVIHHRLRAQGRA